MAQNIYIATPVNARRETTMDEKRSAAYLRVKELEYIISKSVNGAEFAEFHSAFDGDIVPIRLAPNKLPSEAVIMGKCVQRVMECDMVVFDHGWTSSKGCKVEHQTAFEYEKEIYSVNWDGSVYTIDKTIF